MYESMNEAGDAIGFPTSCRTTCAIPQVPPHNGSACCCPALHKASVSSQTPNADPHRESTRQLYSLDLRAPFPEVVYTLLRSLGWSMALGGLFTRFFTA